MPVLAVSVPVLVMAMPVLWSGFIDVMVNSLVNLASRQYEKHLLLPFYMKLFPYLQSASMSILVKSLVKFLVKLLAYSMGLAHRNHRAALVRPET